jgi:predicted DNA-binding transcriptional regulator YafY
VSAQKTERLLNLVICLLSTSQFLAKEQIRAAVPQYADCSSDEAFDRMFERDKDEVREMGIPLETGSNSAWFDDEVGYRVDRAAYALPEVAFEPDELAVLSLASRVWAQATLAGPAARALLKLKAAGVEADDATLAGVEPRVGTSEPAFAGLYAAVRDRRPVTFPYRAGRAGEVVSRRLEPWGIVSWHGRWYVVGHDLDRGATRVFRLSRVAGPVQHVGRPGDVTIPAGVDIRAEVAVLGWNQPRDEATLYVRPGAGVGLRRRATLESPGEAPDEWDKVVIGFSDPESLAAEIAGYGPDVIAVAPTAVRDAVVRRLTAVLAAAS